MKQKICSFIRTEKPFTYTNYTPVFSLSGLHVGDYKLVTGSDCLVTYDTGNFLTQNTFSLQQDVELTMRINMQGHAFEIDRQFIQHSLAALDELNIYKIEEIEFKVGDSLQHSNRELSVAGMKTPSNGCTHPRKKKVYMEYSKNFMYCPDCKADLGDV